MIQLALSGILTVIIAIIVLNVYDMFNPDKSFSIADYIFLITLCLGISSLSIYISMQNFDVFFSENMVTDTQRFRQGPVPF